MSLTAKLLNASELANMDISSYSAAQPLARRRECTRGLEAPTALAEDIEGHRWMFIQR
jgi:hypothetical protein